MKDQLAVTQKALELACKHLVGDISCNHCPFNNEGEHMPACLKPEGVKCVDAVYWYYLDKAEGR